MRDRVSTKILDNGATRYGVYDEDGKLLRYEYIKLEDEPSTEGDFFNKANMLPDSIPKLLGLKMENPQVKDALNVLANVGNLHVWERVQSGVTDYLTSTDRNAYTDGAVDNTTITYLGQLGGGARIEVGGYVGTGTYGSSNPNSLTFGFEPQLVAIFAPAEKGDNAAKLFMLRNVLGASILDFDGNNNGVIVTWSEKSVSWYTYLSSSSALGRYTYQMNYPNYTYRYIAIG